MLWAHLTGNSVIIMSYILLMWISISVAIMFQVDNSLQVHKQLCPFKLSIVFVSLLNRNRCHTLSEFYSLVQICLSVAKFDTGFMWIHQWVIPCQINQRSPGDPLFHFHVKLFHYGQNEHTPTNNFILHIVSEIASPSLLKPPLFGASPHAASQKRVIMLFFQTFRAHNFIMIPARPIGLKICKLTKCWPLIHNLALNNRRHSKLFS